MLVWSIRSVFFLLIASVMLLGFTEGGFFDFKDSSSNVQVSIWFAVIGCFAVGLVGFAIDSLVPRKSVVALAGLFFGVLAGLAIGMAFNYIVGLLYDAYNISERNALYIASPGIKALINILCCYLTVIFVLQTKDDFRFIIPYVEFSKQTKGGAPLILDTSVIIDGRIADIAATKILSSPLVIPRFVLGELQTVADSADRLRRNRGRRGLDMLNKMQNNKELDISVENIDLSVSEKLESVDHRLVSAAKKLGGKIVTNDYNLSKVAHLRGVEVLNINDLANALKSVVLPGESMSVKMIKPGDQPEQGVGYLDDGTMIVVEQGRRSVGKTVDIVVTSVLQTSAGRMIFGKLNDTA